MMLTVCTPNLLFKCSIRVLGRLPGANVFRDLDRYPEAIQVRALCLTDWIVSHSTFQSRVFPSPPSLC